MYLITVDLDDTLIRTSHHYDESMEALAEILNNRFDIDPETTINTFQEIDYSLVSEFGIQKERFPESFKETVKELVEDPSESLLQEVEEIGYDTYKSVDEYAQQGFMDGAREMLNSLDAHHEEIHLVTVGDPDVQHPKIDALNLDEWFDELHVVSHNSGKGSKFEELINTNGYTSEEFYHIGNSASSDVEPAIELNGHAVYISDKLDWLSDEETHNKLVEHPRVTAFETAHDFVNNIGTVF